MSFLSNIRMMQPGIVGRENNSMTGPTIRILNYNISTYIVVTFSIVLLTSAFLLLRTKFRRVTLLSTLNNNNDAVTAKPSKDTKTITVSKKRTVVCPFSAESNFVVNMDLDVPPSPLELYESWIDPTTADFGHKPLAARWLNAGLSGQDTTGLVRAGLKRLRDSKYFLVEEPFKIRDELVMKAKALDNPLRKPKVLVYEKDSIAAQQECLELFLDYLPKRYPELYKYNKETDTLHVVPIDETFYVADWRASRALELCERIVQEDLVLMRPPRENDVDNPKHQFVMAAAAVVFSFNELQEKLGRPLLFIHAPVPGYEKYLLKTIDLTFSKILKIEHPMWRNNWGIYPSGQLDKPLDGSARARENRTLVVPTIEQIKEMFLKVEYQTIRRLPKSQYILFTVKVMVDPLPSLESVPRAAACLAASINGMSPAMRKYKGIVDDATCDVVLSYLDSIAERSTSGEVRAQDEGETKEAIQS